MHDGIMKKFLLDSIEGIRAHGAGLRGGPGVRPEDLVGRAEHLVPGQAAGPGDGRVRHGGRQLLRAEEHFSAPGDSAEREGREDRRLV